MLATSSQSNISQGISDLLMQRKGNLPVNRRFVQVQGENSTRKAQVEEIAFVISKKAFFAAAPNESFAMDLLWSELRYVNSFWPRPPAIETEVTANLHEAGYPYDCVKFLPGGDDEISLIFRKTCEAPTQNCYSFAPLYRGPAEKVIEVPVGHYAIASGNSPKSILAAHHLKDNVIFAAQTQDKIGILANIDKKTDVETFSKRYGNVYLKHQIRGCPRHLYLMRRPDRQSLFSTIREHIVFQEKAAMPVASLAHNVFGLNQPWSYSLELNRSIAFDAKSSVTRLMSYSPFITPGSTEESKDIAGFQNLSA